MKNPLLQTTELPLFEQIRPEHVEKAIDQLITENTAALKQLLEQKTFTWDSLILPLCEMQECLNNAWSPARHLNSTANSSALRTAYQKSLEKLTDYYTELGHNVDLYHAVKSVPLDHLDTAQKKVIENQLRDFHLEGVALSKEKKAQFQAIQKALSKLGTQFEENIMDATDHWELLITDKEKLKGLSETALNAAAETAKQRDKTGWLLTLDYPSYDAVIRYADDRALREKLYRAYVTRASEKTQWDNSSTMDQMLALRHELAQILDFPQYVDYSLATKMAKSADEVSNFILDLAKHVRPLAEKEWETLKQFVKEHYAIEQLNAWDIPYYSEKLKQHLFNLSQEQLRVYFPVDHVIKNMFAIVERLFALRINEVTKNKNVWHKDVRLFNIYTSDNQLQGTFYLDLYARPHKRGGAWMDECHIRYIKTDGSLQKPVAYLTCNFSRPTQEQTALLTHEEVLTLFHEFGHGLHHLLTQINYSPVSGINGVPWDAVEFPSQFLEHWCWEQEALKLLGQHYQTKEPIPDNLIAQMQKAKNFQIGLQTLRQLEFALFDLRIHSEYVNDKSFNIQNILNEVRETLAVIPVPEFNRFQHSFSHIFGGGYAAGYYSYKWAEVMASDAFGQFLETGIFNEATGNAFKTCILEKGGSEDPEKLFIDFRGRRPSIEDFIRQLTPQ